MHRGLLALLIADCALVVRVAIRFGDRRRGESFRDLPSISRVTTTFVMRVMVRLAGAYSRRHPLLVGL
jgi:hypothetical protein